MHDLFIECDGRPHWGKFHFFNQESARAAFPRFDDFNTIRAQFDPDGIFLNEQTQELFG